MKETPTTQTGLALPLSRDHPAQRGFTGMAVTIWDADNEVVAYVPDSNHASELVRIVNAHTELVEALECMTDTYSCECEHLQGEQCAKCKAFKVLCKAKSTGQTQV